MAAKKSVKKAKAKRVNWKSYALGLERDIDNLEFELRLAQIQQDLAKRNADYQFVVARAADQKLDVAYPEAPSTRYTREVY